VAGITCLQSNENRLRACVSSWSDILPRCRWHTPCYQHDRQR